MPTHNLEWDERTAVEVGDDTMFLPPESEVETRR